MPTVIGIDPGPFVSHLVRFNGERVIDKQAVENGTFDWKQLGKLETAIEDFMPYGSPVSADSIRTIKTIGIAEHHNVATIPRQDVKLALCGTLQQIGDKQVREALIERFGPGKDVAVGSKRAPGPLYGISSHFWAALAIAVVHWDRIHAKA